MQFNSIDYAIFVPVVFLLYWFATQINIYNEDYNVLRGKIDGVEFFNTTHLNYSGSVKFTTHLSHYLESQLK